MSVTVVRVEEPRASERGPGPAPPPLRRPAPPRLGLVRSLWRHRGLIAQFVGRDLRGRYQGSALGVAWAALTPLAQLAVYTFVFRSVLGTRWQPGGEEGTGQFAITLFAGLVVFQAFAEAVGRAPGLIAAQPNLVRKVVFPVEILPVTAVAAAFVQAAVGLALVALLATLAGRPPGWNALWLPLVLAPCAAFVLGIAWFLAAVGTFLRDLGHVVPLATQLLIFLTPVFYPLSAAGRWAGWLELNPLAVFVENVRRVWLWDRPPTPSLGAAAGVAFAALWLGYAVFRRARPVFADVV